MNIIRILSIHKRSLHWWLLSLGIVLLAGLLVVGEDMNAYAARAGWRSKNSSRSSRRLERIAATNGKRVALVIGNSNYKDPGDRLFNPVNDAEDITRELRRFGFEVEIRTDLGNEDMRNVITDFGRRASNANVALFYYAGHGIQSKSQNYLIPVDAKLPSEARLEFETVNLNLPLAELENAQSKVNIVMLDACRNNSFGGSFRGRQRGLATPGGIPEGTVIVYATGPGKLSEDEGSNGRNGLFTEGVLKAFRDGKALNLDAVLTTASRHVETVSNGVQSPHVNGPETLKKDFYFVGSPDDSSSDDQRVKELEARLAESERLRQEALHNPPVVKHSVPVAVKEPPSVVVKLPRKSFEPETVAIPAGSFDMGSPDSEDGRSSDEGPVHRVHVKAFRMGKYEVTRGQFRAFVDATSYKTTAEQGDGCYGWTGSTWEKKSEFNWLNMGFAQEDNHPVACVSWNDAVAYTEWLSEQTGKSYRLPFEAEWEYAARAGTTTARYWGNNPNQACKYANVADQTSQRRWNWSPIHECDDGYEATSPVGKFKANAFKLYDMLGNVWEWTCSQYDSNGHSGKETTCANKGNSVARAVRGGAWDNVPYVVRAANRGSLAPAYRNNNLGIRLVQD